MRSRRLAPALVLLALAPPAPAQSPAQAPQSPPDGIAAQIERGARAYEQGNCAEVLAAYAAVPDAENALALDGITLYRWGYCLAAQGRPGAEAKYQKSAESLGFETTTPAARLEAHFYRVNALLNLQRAAEAQEAARLAVERYRGGTLVVPADDPAAWFQLGKLFRDAGDAKGALEPFTRALQVHEKGPAKLRRAYLERILDLATQQQDVELARRVNRELDTGATDERASAAREGRILLAAGDYEGAREAFDKAGRGGGSAAMDAQYAAAAARRALELRGWGREPVRTLPDGRNVADLATDDVRGALREVAVEAFKLFEQGHTVEVPRKKGQGTNAAPPPEDVRRLHDLQARFVGLLVDAVARRVPLQEWCVVDGYPPLVHNPWTVLYVQRAARDRDQQLIP